MASEETNGMYVDRTEATLNSPQPCQLTIKRSSGSNTFVRSTESKSSSETQKAEINVEIQGVNEVSVTELRGSSSSQSQTAEVSVEVQGLKETELHRSISSESQRSEVNVEIQGFRETSLSTSDNIITTRLRTVYSRSSSGSTSGADFDPAIISLQLGSDSAFGPDSSDAPATSPERERKLSDSYYISQTYQISSPEKSSLSVSAVQNVRFKSSKDIEICAHGKVGDDQDPHFVDRFEEVISGEDPNILGSPKDKLSTFAWYCSTEDRSDDLEKLKTTRENVQQMIQSSYMVDDITSVVDRDDMGPDALKPAEDSLTLLSLETKKTSSLNNPSSYDFRFIYDTYAARPEDLPLCQPSDTLKSDKETPASLTYSPGIAIRSYALEELTEKKSRSTPDRVQAAVKSSRFDEDSSQVDIDSGSSVDELPHLSKVDFSHLKSKHSESSVRNSTTQEIHMFKLTKVQKVTLSDEPHPIPNVLKAGEPVSQYTSVQEENKEEDDELLDKLVDLDSIQVGYRFHDVGMMQEAGGICNLAFDDSDETDVPDTSKTYSSQELSSSYMSGGQPATVTSLGSSSVSSSILSSPVNSYTSSSEQSSQIKYGVQETVTTTKVPEDQSSVSAGPGLFSTKLDSDAVDKTSEISSNLSTLQVDAQSTVSVVDVQISNANAGTRNNIAVESTKTIHIDSDPYSIPKDEVSKVKTVESSLNGNLSSEVVSKTQTAETKTLVIDSKTSTQSLVSGSAVTEADGRTMVLDSKTTSVVEVTSVFTDAVVDSKRVDVKLAAAEPNSDVRAADSKKPTGKANSKNKKSAAAKSKNKGSVVDTHAVSKEAVSKEAVTKETVTKETVTKEVITVDKDLKSVSNTAKSDAQKITSDIQAKNAEDKMQNAANVKSAKKHKKKKNKGKKSEILTKNAELSDDNEHANNQADQHKGDCAVGDHLAGTDDVAMTKNVEVVEVEVHAGDSATQSVGQQGSVSMLKLGENQPAGADGVDTGGSVEHVVATSVSAESKLRVAAQAGCHMTLDSVNLTKFGQAENKILSQTSEDAYSISVTNSKTQTLQVESVAMTTLIQESKVSSNESVARSAQAESRDRVLNSVSPSSLEVTRTGAHDVSSIETQALVMETHKGNLNIDSKTIQSKSTHNTGLTIKTPTKPLPRVPVTRTFNVGKKFEPALKSLGAILKSESLSVDVYFDTPEFELTLSDCWLRSHNGKWQLHANFTKLLNETTKLEYSEHEDLETIKSLLSKILKKKVVADGSISMASCVCQLGLKEFVRYRTSKKVYSCGDMTIELNLPEYGFWTGQVTALAPSKHRIQDAVNNIFDLWTKTGTDALNLLLE